MGSGLISLHLKFVLTRLSELPDHGRGSPSSASKAAVVNASDTGGKKAFFFFLMTKNIF